METTEAEPDAHAATADVDLDKEIASAEEVHRILQDVDPKLRFVFILHHMVDVPIPEIAKHLGIPVGTASTRLRLARAAVKAAWIRYKARERHAEQRSNVVPILGALTFMEAARQIPPVPDEVRERVWAGIQERLRGGGGGEDDGPGSEAPGPAAPRSVARALRAALASPAGRVLSVLVAAGAGVVGGALWDPLHRPSGASVSTSSEVTTTPPPPPAQAATASVASSAPPIVKAPAAAASSAVGVLDLDNVLVDRASAALQGGQIDRALAAVQEHAAMFRGGGMRAHDREVVWIAALIRAGRTDEARERLARFASRYPTSPRLNGFRKALGSQ